MTTLIARPRPLIESLTSWEGYSHPSVPVAALAVTIGVVGYSLLPEGDARRRWFIATGGLLGVVAFARLYLGVDHPTDAVTGLMVATAITVLLYKLFVPAQVFPVTYRRRSTAHLDIDAPRRAAIVAALRDQLGIAVTDIRPIGSAASAGSTPLMLTCIGDDGGEETRCLFAKLYAASHLRADRWYKLGRLILYGSLEDEVRYTSVRRLVEYEDYLMRVMAEAAVPGAKTYGFVEITPEREYLLVAEFLEGAVEIGDIDADDDLIHRALGAVCRLWEAGLAHRDIKPSNIMVRDGDVLLIDLAFAQIRPSPWRQAVDLANMMLVLALRADPQRVYARALLQFSPDNIAEAFAATQSVTIPAQTRRLLRRHRRETGEDLVAVFRRLSPHQEPISIQRWSRRRIAVTLATILAALALLSIIVDNLSGQGFM
jgi:tRNA A-37 threonylcarbamoyl transferase component Bud32